MKTFCKVGHYVFSLLNGDPTNFFRMVAGLTDNRIVFMRGTSIGVVFRFWRVCRVSAFECLPDRLTDTIRLRNATTVMSAISAMLTSPSVSAVVAPSRLCTLLPVQNGQNASALPG